MNCSHLYSQGGYCSKTRSYQSVEVELASMQTVSKLKSTALQELVELGKYLGCSGKEAEQFVPEQQERGRGERKFDQNARREEARKKLGVQKRKEEPGEKKQKEKQEEAEGGGGGERRCRKRMKERRSRKTMKERRSKKRSVSQKRRSSG